MRFFLVMAVLCLGAKVQAGCYDLIDYLTHDSRMGIETLIWGGDNYSPSASAFKQFRPEACNVQCSSYYKCGEMLCKDCGNYVYGRFPTGDSYHMAFAKTISNSFGAIVACRASFGNYWCTGEVFEKK